MRKSYLYYKLAIVLLAALGTQSCSKDNSINNTTVIATPYSLYFCDSSGSLWNTNDGIFFKTSVFPSDGVPSLAILTADTNLLWIKSGVPVGKVTAHISTDNGKNFNPTYSPLNPLSFDQTIALYSSDEQRVYIATGDGIYNGVKYNTMGGIPNQWVDDIKMPIVPGTMITSFTELNNNTIVAFDWTTQRLFTKASATAPWIQQIQSTINPLPAGGQFALGHYNNTIVLVDRTGLNGAWYSQNSGVDWFPYSTGLPKVPLNVAFAPFGSTLLVGTDSNGVFALQGSGFVSANGGLDIGTTVRSIVAKENIYVNGVSVQFVYMATNKGIFRSQDLGQNWIPVRLGNYYSVY